MDDRIFFCNMCNDYRKKQIEFGHIGKDYKMKVIECCEICKDTISEKIVEVPLWLINRKPTDKN